jgi:gliding motility-associated lipoprotein GldH
MVQRKLHKPLFFLMLMAFLSCMREEGFSIQKSISREGLSSTPVAFEIPTSVLNETPKDIFIWLRNNAEYEFSNIFLIASLKVNNEIMIQDTLEYAMTSPDGRWLGKGFTELKENKLWWKEGLVIPQQGKVQIEIAQAMRNNGKAEGVSKLGGIVSVGISIVDKQ